MMLPSGNDAAQTLGIYFGNYVNKVEEKGLNNDKSKQTPSTIIDGNIDESLYEEAKASEENPEDEEEIMFNLEEK